MTKPLLDRAARAWGDPSPGSGRDGVAMAPLQSGQSSFFSKKRIPDKEYIQNAVNIICLITVYYKNIFL